MSFSPCVGNSNRSSLRPTFRRAIGVLVAVVTAAAMPVAHAAWPEKPVRLVVPYGPGGSSDVIARLIANEMSKTLGQAVIVDNKAGGSGIIAMQEVARAAPDGYNIVLGHVGTLAVNPAMFPKLPYGDEDFTPIALLAKVPMVFAIGAKVPAKTLPEFVALAKAQPGKLNYGSAGNGSAGHLAFEMLKVTANIDVTHVPYKGTGAQLNDLLAGNTDAASAGPPGFIAQAKAGKIKIIASGSPQRLAALPAVPTVAELGYPGFDSSQWFGILAPAKTPPEIVARLYDAAVKALSVPAVRARLEEDGSTASPMAPAEFAKFIKTERDRWGNVVRKAGLKAE
ncbi:tripartite tricarboxylate transporter substrate binding protein [Variovorax sp. J22R133]|uniref:Bug family tripartite tricarboxylate transporter substrate binding protein n=1 Tax=Variovorax brevis TaxID=3053503 RepID=UPI00257676E7|nr:tripartite tricarboxylate transporter substrate binding protein [Variovorax sp. J22R133]MDM0118125.1 tripartite tricarboxylate transporter substrate binding protein [Variovorax sp. J22R133]